MSRLVILLQWRRTDLDRTFPITGNGRGRWLALTFGPLVVPKVTEMQTKKGKGESVKGKGIRRNEKRTLFMEILNKLVG